MRLTVRALHQPALEEAADRRFSVTVHGGVLALAPIAMNVSGREARGVGWPELLCIP